MKYNMPIDWNAFAYNFSENPQHAFEQLTYFLFCAEHNQITGIFRYFNQPHIETQPILYSGKLIGFQSKYYKPTIKLSDKVGELIEAIEGASQRYPGISKLIFYISIEFSPSTKKTEIAPSYQNDVEKAAHDNGIEIEWRGPSNIEAQLMLDERLRSCREVFFSSKSELKETFDRFESKKEDLFHRIKRSVFYRENEIILDRPALDLKCFLNSDDQVLIVDGVAGSGKSAIVAGALNTLDDRVAALALNSTDLDIADRSALWSHDGSLNDKDFFSVYEGATKRILYLDAVEKYFTAENQITFEELVSCFVENGWKIVASVRDSYTSLLPSTIFKGFKTNVFHVEPIAIQQLNSLAKDNGFFLTEDSQLLELLRIPFYLGLFLELDGIDKQGLNELSKASFREKIWEEIIRNNKSHRDDMPNRRERALLSLTMTMLNQGKYSYRTSESDDYFALELLEKSGVLCRSKDAREYFHGHDVFEELVVNHVFSERWRNRISSEAFFSSFSPTLRVRRLFRNWLIDFAATVEDHSEVKSLLDEEGVSTIWKDEVLRSILSTESFEDVFPALTPILIKGDRQLLRRMVFLLNLCCREPDDSGMWTEAEKLYAFRASKPIGYAWKAVFNLIWQNKDQIVWDDILSNSVLLVLDSWTSDGKNAKTETTKLAGEIGLFLLEKAGKDKNYYYLLRENLAELLYKVILKSAWMIPDTLNSIFQAVIDKTEEDFLFNEDKKDEHIFHIYRELAEHALSDPLHCGTVPEAMPEMTLNLMRKLWLSSGEEPPYSNLDLDSFFGINSRMSYMHSTPHAYHTPILLMLRSYPNLVTRFVIEFTNIAGQKYVESHLNKDYCECRNIILHVDGQQVVQTASLRLWQMYRGTFVGSNLLVSVLMGYEQWLLDVAKISKAEYVTDYCRSVLKKANNVMLTSVIVSVATAFPEKLFPLVCDLLKTKELFRYDASRKASEYSSSFFVSRNSLWEKLRIKSNEMPHRAKLLENIIQEYQTDRKGLTNEDFAYRIETLYQAIDETIADIDTWETDDKYPYFRMDLRRYTKIIDEKTDEEGRTLYAVIPFLSADMEQKSRERRIEQEKEQKYLNLSLWSRKSFEKSEEANTYEEYKDTKNAYRALKELWDLLRASGDTNEEDSYGLLSTWQSISCVLHTSVVLLRDHVNDLEDDEECLCECIILSIAHQFTNKTSDAFFSLLHEMEALAVGIPLLLKKYDDDDNKREDLFCLLLKLQLLDWRSESAFTPELAKQLWAGDGKNGVVFLSAFVGIADSYIQALISDHAATVNSFFDLHKPLIHELLSARDIDVANIAFDQLSKRTVYTLLSLTLPGTDVASVFAEKTKEIIMKEAFCSRWLRSSSDLVGYISRYLLWLADVLLLCGDEYRKKLANALVEYADFAEDNTCILFRWIILKQQTYGARDAFWNLWEMLKPIILELSNQEEDTWRQDNEYPFGIDSTISCYLLGESFSTKDIQRQKLVGEEQRAFFEEIVEKAGCYRAVLHSYSHLLCTVGREPFAQVGIDWIYRLIQNDLDNSAVLYTNTLFELEDYVEFFISNNKTRIREDTTLLQKVQTILGYMMNKGSYAAYFLLETI